MRLWLFDMGTIRFCWDRHRGALTVYSPRREVLGVLALPETTTLEEVAFCGYDAALAKGRIERVAVGAGRVRAQVALYNPYTAEVAVGGEGRTRTFADHRLVSLEADGSLVDLDENGLWVGGRCLPECHRDARALSRAVTAYEESVRA